MTQRNYISAAFFGGFTILMALACADYGEAPKPTAPGGGGFDTVSFAAEIKDTLILWCAINGCHGSSGTFQSGLSLGTGTWNNIRSATGNVGGLTVVPGNAASSNLYLKTTASPPFGDRMPQGGPYISIEAQNAIRDWINQGALDN